MNTPSWMSATLCWKGWQSSLQNLINYGWELNSKPVCKKDGRGKPLYVLGQRIYLTHPSLDLLARFSTRNGEDESLYHIDFMVHHKRFGRKAIRVHEKFEAFDVEDIPVLLDIIQQLQEKYPKTKKRKKPVEDLPMAEIIRLVA